MPATRPRRRHGPAPLCQRFLYPLPGAVAHPLLFVPPAAPDPRTPVDDSHQALPSSSALQLGGRRRLPVVHFILSIYSTFVSYRFKRCVAFLFFVEGLCILMAAVARRPRMYGVEARDGTRLRRDLQPKWSTIAFAPAAGSCRCCCPSARELCAQLWNANTLSWPFRYSCQTFTAWHRGETLRRVFTPVDNITSVGPRRHLPMLTREVINQTRNPNTGTLFT